MKLPKLKIRIRCPYNDNRSGSNPLVFETDSTWFACWFIHTVHKQPDDARVLNLFSDSWVAHHIKEGAPLEKGIAKEIGYVEFSVWAGKHVLIEGSSGYVEYESGLNDYDDFEGCVKGLHEYRVEDQRPVEW